MIKAIITTSTEFYHRWENAPESEVFLKNLHRHILHIEVQVEQFHNDRDIEYIKAKKDLCRFIEDRKTIWVETSSCEMVAQNILEYLRGAYGWERGYEVRVMEDNENGCLLT